MRGYKAFDKDLKCGDFQYEIGKTYEFDGKPMILCERGFQFCKSISECYSFHPMNDDIRICEVDAVGEIVTYNSTEFWTNKIVILSEVEEIWKKRGNIDPSSDGGFFNVGSWNFGNYNTGDHNSGSWNSGDYNDGNCNAGKCNTGGRNVGNSNTGDCNVGSCNSGDYNTGDYNSGFGNSGDYNTGDYNTGDYNTGTGNVGHCNIGNMNTGDWNLGNHNTGDWNKADFETGCFNTKNSNIRLFNKESNMSPTEWVNSEACSILHSMPNKVTEWVDQGDMTDEEKENNPSYKVTGGYLKTLNTSDMMQLWWDSLSKTEKDIIKAIPNFDPSIFEECTGIKVD